jgi:hypothetical protein
MIILYKEVAIPLPTTLSSPPVPDAAAAAAALAAAAEPMGGRYRMSRSELVTTDTELSAMAKAATSGGSRTLQEGH